MDAVVATGACEREWSWRMVALGIRALLVHVKNDCASEFYRTHAGFEPSPGDPLALYLLLKDARKSLQH